MQEDTTAATPAELGLLEVDVGIARYKPRFRVRVRPRKVQTTTRTKVLHQVQTEEGTGDLNREHQETGRDISMGVDQWSTEIRVLTLVQISICEKLCRAAKFATTCQNKLASYIPEDLCFIFHSFAFRLSAFTDLTLPCEQINQTDNLPKQKQEFFANNTMVPFTGCSTNCHRTCGFLIYTIYMETYPSIFIQSAYHLMWSIRGI